jgi:hypothetical protein
MGPSVGIGYGLAGRQRTGRKIPFSFSKYGADLETSGGNEFGRFTAQQLMSGIGYAWVHGKMTYGAQLGVGYSFNRVRLEPGVGAAFGVSQPVSVDVSNSWVLRPKVKAEYFIHRKMSFRSELSYTYTDPDVVIHTGTQDISHEWRPHHVQLSFAVGFFPFRK